MIYQLDGKVVKKRPIGKFTKIVTIPDKLMNFITKEIDRDQTVEFWISPSILITLCITLLKNFGKWTHFTIVQRVNNKKGEGEIYIDGKPLK